MKKAYGIKLYLRYLLHYWWVALIAVAVCGMAAMGYALFTRPAAAPAYEGSITVRGLGSFWEAESIDNLTDAQVTMYESIRSDALSVMQGSQVRTATYRRVNSEWAEFKNKSRQDRNLENEFFESLSVRAESGSVHVSFRDRNGKVSAAFTEKVVTVYLEVAKEAAIAYEPLLAKGDGDRLDVTAATESVDSNTRDSISVTRDTVIGVVGGLVLGCLVVLIMYACDRRLHAYEDIADVTGNRLLGTMSSEKDTAVMPQIECALGEKKTVAVLGDAAFVRMVANGYADYAKSAGYRTLVLDFGGEGDGFGGVLDGTADVSDASVLTVGASRARFGKEKDKVAALKAKFDRIVIGAPFTGDGSTALAVDTADGVIFAVDPASMRLRDVAELTNEAQAGEKAMGAVLGDCSGVFVGDTMYVPPLAEE